MKKILAMIIVLAMVFCLGAGAATAVLAAAGPGGEDAAPTDAVIVTAGPGEAAEGPGGAVDESSEPEGSITAEINEIISAGLKIVLAVISIVVTKYIIPFTKNTLAPVIRDTIIPWLEEHHVRSLIQAFVGGAEQKGANGQIDKKEKKQYVLDLLRARGIEITPEIDNWVEDAVLGLDKTWQELLQEFLDALKKKNGDLASALAGLNDPGAAAEYSDPSGIVPAAAQDEAQVEGSPDDGQA